MYVNKWCTFGASTFLQLVGGMCYTFPLYAPALKEALQLSQPALETVGTAILSGGYFAPLAGFVYDKLQSHNKLGPRCGPHARSQLQGSTCRQGRRRLVMAAAF